MPASISPISVVGTRMWAIPRRISDAESVTMSEQTPPPKAMSSPRRLSPCENASAQTDCTSSIDFVSSRTFRTSVETVSVFSNTARIAEPYIRSTVGVVTSSALRSPMASTSALVCDCSSALEKTTW